MSLFWAEFVAAGPIWIRKDARVYFTHGTRPRGSGVCRGSIVMCNPGSAKPPPGYGGWGQTSGDTTLRTVHNVMTAALKSKTDPRMSGQDGFAVGPDDYIEVLNCCYITTVKPPANCGCGHFQAVSGTSRFVWAAWGSKRPAGLLANATRVLATRSSAAPVFWADLKTGSISRTIAPINPVHPQRAAWCVRYPNYETDLAAELARYL